MHLVPILFIFIFYFQFNSGVSHDTYNTSIFIEDEIFLKEIAHGIDNATNKGNEEKFHESSNKMENIIYPDKDLDFLSYLFSQPENLNSHHSNRLDSPMQHNLLNQQQFLSSYDPNVLSIEEAFSLPIFNELEGKNNYNSWNSNLPQQQQQKSFSSMQDDDGRKRKASSSSVQEYKRKNSNKNVEVSEKTKKNNHFPALEATINKNFPDLQLQHKDDAKIKYRFCATTLQERHVLAKEHHYPIQYITLEDTKEFESISISMLIIASQSATCKIELIANDLSFNTISWIKSKDYEIKDVLDIIPLKEDKFLKQISYQLQFNEWKKVLPMMIRLKLTKVYSFQDILISQDKRLFKRCDYELIDSIHVFHRRSSYKMDSTIYENIMPWVTLMKVSNIHNELALGKLKFVDHKAIEKMKLSFPLLYQDDHSLIFGFYSNIQLNNYFSFNLQCSVYPWEFLVNKNENTLDSTEVSLVIVSSHKDCIVQIIIVFENNEKTFDLEDDKWKEGKDYTIQDITSTWDRAASYQKILNEKENRVFQVNYHLNYKSKNWNIIKKKAKSFIGLKFKNNYTPDQKSIIQCKYSLLEGSQKIMKSPKKSPLTSKLKWQYPWMKFS